MNVEEALEYADENGFKTSHPDRRNEDALDTLANEVRHLRADRLADMVKAIIPAVYTECCLGYRELGWPENWRESIAIEALQQARALCAALDEAQEQEAKR